MTAQQLKNSILQMAVQGKLVPQDPADEPASVLVERIRAEKEQLVKEKKIKKEKNPSHIYRGEDGLFYEKIGAEVRCISDELPFDLPESWEWVRFENLVNYTMGKTPPRKESIYWENATFPWVSIADLISDGILLSTKENVNSYSATNSFKNRISPKGTLLMSFKLTVGKVSILGIDAFHNEAIISIYPFVDTYKIMTNYLFMSLPLISQNGETKSAIKGNTLNSDSINSLLVPLPPLAEQQRIVYKYNELLPSIEKYDIAHSKIEKLNKNFPEQLKKSVLQWAVQGKLVEQDPTDEPASVLIERIRAEKAQLVKDGKIKKDKQSSIIYKKDGSYFERTGETERCIDEEIPFDIPESWEWVRLNELAVKIGSGSTPTGGKAVYVKEGIKFIRSQNVYNDGLRLFDIAYITEATNHSKSGSIVFPRDILLNITGGSIGRCAVVADDFDIANINQHVMIIRLVNYEMRKWLHSVLISDYVQNMIMSVQVGVSREGLSATKLKDFLIPLPPLSEQQRIVDKAEEILGLCGDL